jgi:hypothetical protein
MKWMMWPCGSLRACWWGKEALACGAPPVTRLVGHVIDTESTDDVVLNQPSRKLERARYGVPIDNFRRAALRPTQVATTDTANPEAGSE